MKNKTTISFIRLYDPFSITAMKEYLEGMAENGWLLAEADDMFVFEKAEPVHRVYLVEYFKYRTNEDVKAEYISSCREKGWKQVPGENEFLIFFGTQELDKPIDIGDKVRLHERDNSWLTSIVNLLLLIFIIIISIVISDIFSLTHNVIYDYMEQALIIVGGFIILLLSFFDLWWFLKNTFYVKKGLPLEYRNTASVRKMNNTIIGVTSLYLLLLTALSALFLIWNEKNYAFVVLITGFNIVFNCLVSSYRDYPGINKKDKKKLHYLFAAFTAALILCTGGAALCKVLF